MTLRQGIFWTHFVAGLVAGLIILWLSITGCLLAFKPQMDDFFNKKISTVSTSGTALDIEGVLDAAKHQYPKQGIKSVAIKNDVKAAVAVVFDKAGLIYFDPYTGQSIGSISRVSGVLKQMESLHRWFGLEKLYKEAAHQVKGAATAILCVLLLSGIYLWWPFKMVSVKTNLKGKSAYFNWHTALGFWSAPFLLAVALSGVVMTYQPGLKEPKFLKEGQQLGQPVRLQELFVMAQMYEPQWTTITLRFGKNKDVYPFFIESDNSGWLKLRSKLVVLSDATVVQWQPASSLTFERKFRSFVRYIHTGELGGLIGQLVAFLATLGSVILVLTGFVLAFKRFQK